MPELPEIETTRRGLEPHCSHRIIKDVIVRNPNLRWPVPSDLASCCTRKKIKSVSRRAKYLLFNLSSGTIIIHLGMSGSLRIVSSSETVKKHDHVDFILSRGLVLRYHDPRRFGSIHWWQHNINDHPLFQHLGPEPLDSEFSGEYLFKKSRSRTLAVKNFIMNSAIVVGVGNIYANEALFYAGIHPNKSAKEISLQAYKRLVVKIRNVLNSAIEQGGTTLRDFVNGNGQPGYFAQKLAVYGKDEQKCSKCNGKIEKIVIGQRATYFCMRCQR